MTGDVDDDVVVGVTGISGGDDGVWKLPLPCAADTAAAKAAWWAAAAWWTADHCESSAAWLGLGLEYI